MGFVVNGNSEKKLLSDANLTLQNAIDASVSIGMTEKETVKSKTDPEVETRCGKTSHNCDL